ncbi:flagellar biosynthesis anti-sigma factor FlgM [Enterovibrio nigricans]|uniref:Negative regulator of flagellin synthesis n=1 Tax=Enterovibrio nigricans DSM 22720 TaxID=1121868 RepID=A0A1T4UKI5_9GAMM|nr:flagellar biosynthesis anti-sigma factor FlgM [Enterovibrio nigricans]PKF51207.1 flagellar biosynthesis anti-sigma factor FlgM [Enterovibrio nigricans]SKA53163.1 anti-sigma-28 factor, FlgM family [Enterovibrio nigricans DSM 22720]
MKIDKVAGGHVPQSSLNQASNKQLETPTRPASVEPQVNVNTAAIEQAQKDLSSLADIDMAKVEAVRSALHRGELNLDMKALSQAVMMFHTGRE